MTEIPNIRIPDTIMLRITALIVVVLFFSLARALSASGGLIFGSRLSIFEITDKN
jgi:hypothetical protein